MKTLLYSTAGAIALGLGSAPAPVHAAESPRNTCDYCDDHGDGYRVDYDNGVLTGGDHVTAGGYPNAGSDLPPVTEGGRYDGAWSGNYVGPDGRVFEGSWSGTYSDEQGQSWPHTYSGTFIEQGPGDAGAVTMGHGDPGWSAEPMGAPYAPPAPAPYGYDDDYSDDRYRGDRDRAMQIERCRRDPRRGGSDCHSFYHRRQSGTYAQGYYYPHPMVTTVVIHPGVTTTTTVVEEEY